MMRAAVKTVAPRWNAPRRVRAVTTLRAPGLSRGRYAELNLAAHGGDDAGLVARNRELLRRSLQLPAPPLWLRQRHGAVVVDGAKVADAEPEADGCLTEAAGVVCAVLSADCLPVFLCRGDGSAVALLHAGWRGIAAGILEAGAAALGNGGNGAPLLAAFGPAIGADAFVVGDEVRAALTLADGGGDDGGAFRPAGDGRHHADLYALAAMRLRRLGVSVAPPPKWCTFRDESKFFSHRRDRQCGRMASLLWLRP